MRPLADERIGDVIVRDAQVSQFFEHRSRIVETHIEGWGDAPMIAERLDRGRSRVWIVSGPINSSTYSVSE
jgi:hypothetical protein